MTTDRPEVDDPRVLALAKARQQMAYENPFNVVCPPWDGLTSDEQQLSLLDARNYLRAALKAGLFASSAVSVVPPAANQTAPVDRAATFREAAEALGRMDYDTDSHDYGYDTYRDAWNGGVMDGADLLRRLAAEAAVVPPPALTEEGRLRAQVEVLQQDAERDRGLAKVGARCMRVGHQGLIEQGRLVLEGWRFALSTALGLGTGAPWEAIHDRAKELAAEAPHAETPDEARPCDGCGHLEHQANKCLVTLYGERCACDEPQTAPAVVAQPGKETDTAEPPRVVQCSRAILSRPHEAHGWYPQPGMDPVDCPGYSFTEAPQ